MRSPFALICLVAASGVACTPDWKLHVKDAGADASEADGNDGGIENEDAGPEVDAAGPEVDAAGPVGASDAGGPKGDADPNDGAADAGCGDGYVLRGGACTDVDECFEGTHACHMTATCENTEGAYDCTCPLGYSGGTSAGFACAPRVAMGNGFACALQSDGRVKCWGTNGSGELGDGTQLSRLTPVFVKGLDHVVAIAAHDSTSACALRDDGQVVCWGDNTSGQLGDGTVVSRSEPREVSKLADVLALSVRDGFACAVVKDGSLRCWGSRGRLGSDGIVTSRTPSAFGAIPAMSSVEAGWGGTGCAVTSAGALWCWGSSSTSQPLQLAGFSDVVRVATGTAACVLRASATLQCWTKDPAVSTEVSLNNVVSLSLGLETAYAVGGDGHVYQWLGLPGSVTGQYASTAELDDAVVVAGGGAGSPSACAVVRDGTVRCWGINSRGQLGDGTTVGTSEDTSTKIWKVTTVSGLSLW